MDQRQTKNQQPDLSIVIAIIAGGQQALTLCLEALAPSAKLRSVECIVPYDERLDGLADLALRFPWAEFFDASTALKQQRFGNSSREHHDILRAAGLIRAKGRIVALLEDHGTPCPGWIDAVIEAHESNASAIGGAVENGIDRILNWAVYYCDFGRYQNPVPEGAAEFLSDSNISYKRDALRAVKDLWVDAFHETSVNWELRRRGNILQLHRDMVVYQTRSSLKFLPALSERFVWGRSFAGTRASEVSTSRRVLFATLSFLLPLILSYRIVLQTVRKRRNVKKMFLALPLIVLLHSIWALGEFVGYLTGRTGGQQHNIDVPLRRAA